MTVAQTMEIVYGLFNNMKIVMDGMKSLHLHLSFLRRAECQYP